jgi:integrase
VIFCPTAEVWSFRDGVMDIRMNFAHFANVSEEFLLSMKAVLMLYMQRYSPRYSEGIFFKMKSLSKFIFENFEGRLETISFEQLAAYRATNVGTHEPYLSGLAAFLKRWSSLGYPGVDQSAVRYLSGVKLKGYEKGVAVRTMDPITGPLTVMETGSLLSALVEAFAKRDVDIQGYLLGWLFIALGMRPVQFAAMKVCDLKVLRATDGEDTFLLSIPRAKQQGVTQHRDLSRERAILPEVGRLLEVHIENVKSDLKGRLANLNLAPLFPAKSGARSSRGFEFHRTAGNLADLLKRVMNSLGVLSERTGEELHLTPIRFRRTIGTRAAEEGHGVLVIAELLDHSDTQNAGVYTEATPAIIERIDRAIAIHMAPLAQAFAGKLIQNEADATRGTDPSSRIVDLRIDQSGRAMGSCGQSSYCGFSAPIACYRCPCFEPWLDGPHEAVFQFLLDRRENLLLNTDRRIASVNDLTILAVAEVVRLCAEYKNNGMDS